MGQEGVMNKPICILVSGRAGTGKDTAAKYLYSLLASQYNVAITHFAFGLKEIAKHMGWDGAKDEKGRSLLQDIGKVGREYNINTWCRYTFEKLLPCDFLYPFDIVIVPDWRFPNEQVYVSNYGYRVLTLRIEAPEREMLKGTDRYDDVSEVSLPSGVCTGYYDYVVGNSGTYDELKEQLKTFVETYITLE